MLFEPTSLARLFSCHNLLKADLQLGLHLIHTQLLDPSTQEMLHITSPHCSLDLVQGKMHSTGRVQHHFLAFVWILLLCFTYMPYASALLTSGAVASPGLILTAGFPTQQLTFLDEAKPGSAGQAPEEGFPAHSTPVSPFWARRRLLHPPQDRGTGRAASPGVSSRSSLSAGV